MSPRRGGDRYDAEGNYLLPSERAGDREEIAVGEDGQPFYEQDALDVADGMSGITDDLTRKAMLRSQEHARLETVAPFARINPPSILKGTMGGQDRVATGDGVTEVERNAQVALWGGDDAETTSVTVTFSQVQQLNNAAGLVMTSDAVVIPYGIIQFGTRGFLVKAEVDIGLGCQITLSASRVSLQVALEPTTGIRKTAQLSGMLSFHPIVRTKPITRTKYFTTAVAAVTVLCPAFAKDVVVFRDTIGVAMTLLFLDSNAAVRYVFTLAAGVVQTDDSASNVASKICVDVYLVRISITQFRQVRFHCDLRRSTTGGQVKGTANSKCEQSNQNSHVHFLSRCSSMMRRSTSATGTPSRRASVRNHLSVAGGNRISTGIITRPISHRYRLSSSEAVS